MRVALISSEKLPVPPVRGGAVQTYIAAVSSRLAQRHDVTVFGTSDPTLPQEEMRQGVRYVRVPSRENDWYSYIRHIVRRVSAEEFDVIEIFNRPLSILPIHKASPGSRLVLSLHNEMFRETKIPRELALPALEKLEAIVTVSEFIGRSVLARYPKAGVKLIPLYSGVNLERFMPKGSRQADERARSMRRELGIGDGPVILFVGRLSPSKGPHVLLDAFSEVVTQIPNARLVFVGSRWFSVDDPDPYVRELWNRARHLKGSVIFTGHVPYNDVHRYFSLADVCVCPSQWMEPLARVLYEAMAVGLPIVTTNRGGNPEVVADGVNGIILDDWNNPSAFARAILRLFADPHKASAMGQNGRRLVKERFHWDRVAGDLEKVLVRAAARPSPKEIEQVRINRGVVLPCEGDTRMLYDNNMLSDTLKKLRSRTLAVLELIGQGQGKPAR